MTSSAFPRRGLLAGALAGAGGAAVGVAAGALVGDGGAPAAAAAEAPPPTTEPFHGPHQAGVATPAQAHAVFLALDLKRDVPFVAESFMGVLARHVQTLALDPRHGQQRRRDGGLGVGDGGHRLTS